MDNYGLLSLLPPLVAIVLCITTKQLVLSLFAGSFVGALVLCCSGARSLANRARSVSNITPA